MSLRRIVRIPPTLRTEFLTAALLIPTLSKDVSADQATLARPVGDVDLAALDKKDQSKFDASLKQAQQSLEPLKPTLQQADMHLTGNSHIDAAWLWPWTETVDVVKRTFGTAAPVDERVSRRTPIRSLPRSTTSGSQTSIRS